MTENSDNTSSAGQGNGPVIEQIAAQKRFVLYRTQAVGWQAAGYILLVGFLARPEDGIKFPGTAWVEDTDGKYQPGDVFPLPDGPAPAAAPETTPAR